MPVDAGGVGAGKQGRARGGGADRRLAAVVFALLVVGCFAALLITQRLKHTPTLVQEFKLTNVIAPASSGGSKEEHIAFKLAKADVVTVTIEGSSGETVATLVRNRPVGRYKTLSLRWNGRKGTAHGYRVLRRADGYTTLMPRNRGQIAPAGEYTVRVSLREEDRSVPSTRTFKLVAP
ncbi:MAG TPA: hypothetical protein VIJ39_06715 [Solirubrobacteraceae bacterium]